VIIVQLPVVASEQDETTVTAAGFWGSKPVRDRVSYRWCVCDTRAAPDRRVGAATSVL